jgi:hypothetical protein
MGKIKEPIVAYKPSRASSRRGLLTYTASELRSLPPRERSRILTLQARHAAAMNATDFEEVINDSSPVIEY